MVFGSSSNLPQEKYSVSISLRTMLVYDKNLIWHSISFQFPGNKKAKVRIVLMSFVL